MKQSINQQSRRRRFAAALAVACCVNFLPAPRPAAAENDIRRDAVVAAVEKVLPSVVNIGTKTKRERRGYYYDWFRDNWVPYQQDLPPQEAAGSGVVIDEEGYVLTNNHVAEGADEIWVNVEGRVLRADVVGETPRTDIALLKLRAKPGEKFRAAKFAADNDLILGETVIALGNPFGLGASVSRGILSSKNRRVAVEVDGRLDVPDWLQTDAAINPGNSGGPLINLRGEVIGINVAVFKGGQGIGFAIPINRVTETLAEIFSPEGQKQLWFGAQVKAGALPLRVAAVQPESPAGRAGLQAGDVIVDVDERAPRSFIAFNNDLLQAGAQRPVSLTVRRGAELKTLRVALEPEAKFFNGELIRKKIGATVQPLTPELADRLGLGNADGLILNDVEKDGPAATAGLRAGMVIQAIDGQPVSSAISAAKLLNARSKGDTVRVTPLIPVRRANLLVGWNRATAQLVVR